VGIEQRINILLLIIIFSGQQKNQEGASHTKLIIVISGCSGRVFNVHFHITKK
jgi:hypothetical protein